MKKWLSLAGVLLTACIAVDEIYDDLPIDDLSKIEVTPNNLALMVNESTTLMATFYDASGMMAGATFGWVSTNPQIASVDNTGLVTALQPGSSRIRVTANNNPDLSAEAMVNVVNDPNQVGTIEIEIPDASIEIDEMIQLTAIAKNVQGEAVEGVSFSWESDDLDVLEVTQSGKATGKANGVASVTASAEGVSSPSYTITVGAINSRTGAFQGRGGYTVKGTATLSAGTTGDLSLAFSDDFAADNGPGLYVYLTKASDNVTGGVELGALSSNEGAQTYNVSSDVEIGDYDFVLIYCKPFGVPFGFAELEK